MKTAMTIKTRSHALLLLFGLFAMGCVQARMYKWIGPDGVVQYTQTPPPAGAVEEIAPPPPPTVAPEAAMQRLRDREEAVRKARQERELDKGIANQQAEMSAAREKNCRISRSNLQKLMDNPGGLMKLPDGSYQRVSEETRQQRIEDARKGVADFCN